MFGLIFITHLKESFDYSILSLYQNSRGDYFGYYSSSGIRPITGRLFFEMYQNRINLLNS